MRVEVKANLPRARVGRGSMYREGAIFVLKILPDMDRDTQYMNRRMAARMAAGRKRGWLTRREIPLGTAGYLYAQARAFLSGIESQTRGMSVIALSEFEFGEPRIVGAESSPADESIRVSAKIPASHWKPPPCIGPRGRAAPEGRSRQDRPASLPARGQRTRRLPHPSTALGRLRTPPVRAPRRRGAVPGRARAAPAHQPIAHYALSAAALDNARTVNPEHLQHAVEELRP